MIKALLLSMFLSFSVRTPNDISVYTPDYEVKAGVDKSAYGEFFAFSERQNGDLYRGVSLETVVSESENILLDGWSAAIDIREAQKINTETLSRVLTKAYGFDVGATMKLDFWSDPVLMSRIQFKKRIRLAKESAFEIDFNFTSNIQENLVKVYFGFDHRLFPGWPVEMRLIPFVAYNNYGVRGFYQYKTELRVKL